MRRGISLFLCVLLFLFSALPTSAARIVYSFAGGAASPRVALTFDDGPHPRYTPQILDILREYGVSATFFSVGSNAENYPDLIRRICKEGHELGNHTHNHFHVAKLSREQLCGDIQCAQEVLERLGGEKIRFFRPPEGVCTEAVKSYCEQNGMIIVLWSVDTRDWAHTPVGEICENVRKNAKNGSIILMHDFIGKNSPTPAALRRIIPMLQELGYEFVTVSQLLGEAE
jgi:peptidoglycan/xylan/chitin deacetylase (PgdA/CDA1 family)